MSAKCKQNLCQRTKKISQNGNCDVCQNVIEDITKKNEVIRKPSNFKKVELDLKMMHETHKKLVSGCQVDSKVVNTLLLGGVVNILIQSEGIEAIEKRMKAMECEVLTNKTKIEYLENWVISQNDTIEDLRKKLGNVDEEDLSTKNIEVDTLKKKVEGIENEICHLKTTSISTENVIKCEECDKTFTKTYQLELHLEEHKKKKQFKCEICGKEFFLEWRKKKHMKIHSENPKVCKYFDKTQPCPYEQIGCMFSHETNDPLKDTKEQREAEEMETNENEEFTADENQCHLCRVQLSSKDDLFYHVAEKHKDYFQGMMEVMANATNL